MGEGMERSWELLRSGDYAGAREKREPAALGEGAPLDVLHNYAVSCYKLGKFAEASETCRRALGRFGDSHRTRYLLGVVLKEAGEIDAACGVLSELVEASPDSPRAYYHRGTCHFLRGRVREAEADLERAATLDPINLAGRYNLGVVHVTARQWEKAREDFTACLRLDPAGAEEYAGLLVEIGRSQVCERVYGQGHRLKNMLGIVGDRLKTALSEVRSRLANGEKAQLDEIAAQEDLIFSDLAAFLATLEPSPLELDLADVREIVGRALFTASPSTRQDIHKGSVDAIGVAGRVFGSRDSRRSPRGYAARVGIGGLDGQILFFVAGRLEAGSSWDPRGLAAYNGLPICPETLGRYLLDRTRD